MKKVALCVKVPETVKETLRDLSYEGRTVSDLVNYALEDFLARQYLYNLKEELASMYADYTRYLVGFKDLEPRIQAAYMRSVAKSGIVGYYYERTEVPLTSFYNPYWAEQGRL